MERHEHPLSRDDMTASVSRASAMLAGGVRDADGSLFVGGAHSVRGLPGVNQAVEDLYNKTRVEHGVGKRPVKTAPDYPTAVAEWADNLHVRIARLKTKMDEHFASGTAESALNIIHMPFMLAKVLTDDECRLFHALWDDGMPFAQMIDSVFPAPYDTMAYPIICHGGRKQDPVMFAVAVGVMKPGTMAAAQAEMKAEANEEDPTAMD